MRKQSARRKLASNLLSRGLSSLGKTLKTPVSQLTGKQKLLGALGAGGAIAGGKLLYTSFPELSTSLQKALDQYQVGKALSEVKNYKDYLGIPVAEDTAHFLDYVTKDPASLAEIAYRRAADLSARVTESKVLSDKQQLKLNAILRDINFPSELPGDHFRNSPLGRKYLEGADTGRARLFLKDTDYLNEMIETQIPLGYAEEIATTNRLLKKSKDVRGALSKLQSEVAGFLGQRGPDVYRLPSDSDLVQRARRLTSLNPLDDPSIASAMSFMQTKSGNIEAYISRIEQMQSELKDLLEAKRQGLPR